jgi:dihydroneopterin aldolase
MYPDFLSPGLRHVFLRDLVLDASIGIHAHEHGSHQRVRINVDLAVTDDGESDRALGREDIAAVVDYQKISHLIRHIVDVGHIRLAETLAERIAAACLAHDRRIKIARIRIEKLDVFHDAVSAGVAIERRQSDFCPPSAPIAH